MSESDPRRILGAFIRAHRERLAPPARTGGRRRTPGLRREELADAAGLGVTWVTWLEQGRNVAASATALGRLAEALRLNAAERASLFDLAGKRDPAALPDSQADPLPGLLALPALISAPAYLLDHAWTARAWNGAAAKLFVGWLDKKAEDRNLLRFVFLSREARALIADWPERARRIVAEFRADYNRRPRDEAMQALVDELSAQSAPFLEHWRDQAVLHREGGERKFHHPMQGELRYVQTTLLVAARQELKLVCLVPLAGPLQADAPARAVVMPCGPAR